MTKGSQLSLHIRCSCDKNCFQEMCSIYTGLEMRQNRFRPGLCPRPHWCGGGCPSPWTSCTPPRTFGPRCLVSQTIPPPQKKPSYSLVGVRKPTYSRMLPLMDRVKAASNVMHETAKLISKSTTFRHDWLTFRRAQLWTMHSITYYEFLHPSRPTGLQKPGDCRPPQSKRVQSISNDT